MLILGGLGALIIGMKLLQDGTEKLATGSLEKLFAKTAKNPWAGIGIGTLTTMIIQSSGATTVMVVGFVNAGVMTLYQAVYYIMGANIGTTITAQIVALGGLSGQIPFTQIIISLTLVGVVINMFFAKKKEKVAQIGSLISGLGLLFLGLNVMTENMNTLFTQTTAVKDMLTSINNPFILLLIGLILTAIAQSSSAITSIIIAMAISGVVIGGSGNGVLYVILGSNIGSTATALISSFGSTTNGKRAAIIHLLFNTFGALLFFVILVCIPNFLDSTFGAWFPDSPSTQIAMFHTFFNVCCTILFFPLAKVLVKLSEIIIPDKSKKTKGKTEIEYLDKRFLKNPGIALNQAITYYHLMAAKALKDLNLALDAFIDKDTSKTKEVDLIEEKVLSMSKELTSFIIAVTTSGISENGAKRLSRMQFDIADIVRLTEVADNITGYTGHEVNEHLIFSDIVFNQLKDMKELLNQQFKNTSIIVDKPSLSLLAKTREMEDSIDSHRSKMISEHMERLSQGKCSPSSSGVFINLVGNLERCGDHLNFISERACEGLIKKPEQTGKA